MNYFANLSVRYIAFPMNFASLNSNLANDIEDYFSIGKLNTRFAGCSSSGLLMVELPMD